MSNVEKLEISDNFTLEDIRKIRDHSYSQWLEDPEAWRKDLKESSAKMQTQIDKIKKARKLATIN